MRRRSPQCCAHADSATSPSTPRRLTCLGMSPAVTELAYLDHAATSAVRPVAVRDAVVASLDGIGATPGRRGHRLASDAGRIALLIRPCIARLLHLTRQ